jgi:hypothetical protein
MTEPTQKSEYRLLLWTLEGSSSSNTVGSSTVLTPAALSPRPMPPIPTRFGGSWSAGLGKAYVPSVVSSMVICGRCQGKPLLLTQACQGGSLSGTTSKTKKWRLANAPGLTVSPDIDDTLEYSNEPELVDELLIALTTALQSGELKNEGW